MTNVVRLDKARAKAGGGSAAEPIVSAVNFTHVGHVQIGLSDGKGSGVVLTATPQEARAFASKIQVKARQAEDWIEKLKGHDRFVFVRDAEDGDVMIRHLGRACRWRRVQPRKPSRCAACSTVMPAGATMLEQADGFTGSYGSTQSHARENRICFICAAPQRVDVGPGRGRGT